MISLKDRLADFGVIPVVAVDSCSDAIPLAVAVQAGGLPVLEVTFRTDAAADVIRAIKKNCPDILVGAGTILTLDHVEAAKNAGADFMVAPGLNTAVVQKSLDINIPFIPGCATATEIEAAMALGLDMVKFFPAEAQNARAVITSFNGPYPNIKYMPTGGVNLKNLDGYLTTENIICCGGSWIAPPALINAKDFAQIKQNTIEAVARVKEIRKKAKNELPDGL